MINDLSKFADIYLLAFKDENGGIHRYLRYDNVNSYGSFTQSFSDVHIYFPAFSLGKKYQEVSYQLPYTVHTYLKGFTRSEGIYHTYKPQYESVLSKVPSTIVETTAALSVSQILDIFENMLKREVKLDTSTPLQALEHLQKRVQAKYYSGISGNLYSLFLKSCGFCDFKQNEVNQRIEKIKQSIISISSPEKFSA